MKIRTVTINNRKKSFEVEMNGKQYGFPFSKLEIRPTPQNQIKKLYVDRELGNEGFTYELESGEEGTVHGDDILDYNCDPAYLRDLLLYRLTLGAQKRVKSSRLSKRELIRRLGTSAAQFYRLLDQTNYKKSIDQMVALLNVLDCDVDVVLKERRQGLREAG